MRVCIFQVVDNEVLVCFKHSSSVENESTRTLFFYAKQKTALAANRAGIAARSWCSLPLAALLQGHVLEQLIHLV